VAPYHDPSDEPVAAEKFDWSFNDADLPIDTWKVMMYGEILGTASMQIPMSFYDSIIDFHQTGDVIPSEDSYNQGLIQGQEILQGA
jgi:p38 MAP kinase